MLLQLLTLDQKLFKCKMSNFLFVLFLEHFKQNSSELLSRLISDDETWVDHYTTLDNRTVKNAMSVPCDGKVMATVSFLFFKCKGTKKELSTNEKTTMSIMPIYCNI